MKLHHLLAGSLASLPLTTAAAQENLMRDVKITSQRVADNVYFVSWPTRPGSGDNVVFDLEQMTVNAHLGGGAAFKLINGVVVQPDCVREDLSLALIDKACNDELARVGQVALEGRLLSVRNDLDDHTDHPDCDPHHLGWKAEYELRGVIHHGLHGPGNAGKARRQRGDV